MQLKDNGLRFSPITIALHWAVVVLLAAIASLHAAARAGDAAQRLEWTQARNLAILLLFLVSVYRLRARLTAYHPLPVGSPNPIEVIVSRSVAVALALAMVLLPIAAWLTACAGGEIASLPGGWSVPAPFGPDPGARRVFALLFRLGALGFGAGLALHAFGALKNHFVLKNDTLRRMLGKHVEL